MNQLDILNIVFTLESLVFLSTIFFHFIKKDTTLILMYALQSLCVIAILAVRGISENAHGLLLAAALTFTVKIILAPLIFARGLKGADERMPPGTYLNIPLALVAMLMLFLFSGSHLFDVFDVFAPHAQQLVHLALAGIFMSVFLTMNNREVFHQIMGVLGMENNIVVLGSLLGLEHTFALELGITFDVFVWMVGASTFLLLIRRHFGTLDSSVIKDLRE